MEINSSEEYDVSIAILTFNAGMLLDRLMSSVVEQDTSLKVEVVAVDSGSTDGTLDLLKRYGVYVEEISNTEFDFGATRDLAFEKTRGPIIVSLSQDAVPAHPKWIENLVRPLVDSEYAVSCGRSITDPDRTYTQFPWERNGYFYFTREIRKFTRRYGRGLSNANSAFRRPVWEKLRFGRQPIGEDFMFQTKLEGTDFKIAFPDDAPVYHHHDYSLRQLAKRCRNEGFGLRKIGCTYSELDLIIDLIGPRKYLVWLRELLAGNIRNGASMMFPVIRPFAVYAGSRFGKEYIQ